jgi:hypothetical protein
MTIYVLQVEVLVHVVSALFDINPSMSSHMAPALWRRCVGVLFEVSLPPLKYCQFSGPLGARCKWGIRSPALTSCTVSLELCSICGMLSQVHVPSRSSASSQR